MIRCPVNIDKLEPWRKGVGSLREEEEKEVPRGIPKVVGRGKNEEKITTKMLHVESANARANME